jgi:hypothetical protein
MAAILNNVRLMQETSVVHPHRTTAYHGETVTFTIDFRSYGAQVNLTGATAALYWRVPSDEEGYWHQAEATCSGSTAEWVWDASMDNGESPVTWFLKVDSDDSNETTSYRATGEIRLLASPGFTPAVVPPARMTLDFDLINVLHAPYYTKDEADGRFAASSDIALEAAEFGAWDLSPLPVTIQEGTPNIVSAGDGDYQWRIGAYAAYSEEHYTTEAAAQAETAITISGPDCPTATEITRAATAYRLGPDAAANPNRDKTLAPADAIPAVVAPSTSSSDAGKAADAKSTGDALAGKLDKSGGTVTGMLTAQQFYATGSGNSFVVAPGEGMATTLEHPGIITVTEQTGTSTIVVFVPGTVAAAANPARTMALLSDLPTSETWTFEVDDGQGGTETVTKSVAVFAQAAQGGTP